MKSYKEMDWEELEDCAEKIRREIRLLSDEAELWESRDVDMPTPDFYSRIDELKEELGRIASLQEAIESK